MVYFTAIYIALLYIVAMSSGISEAAPRFVGTAGCKCHSAEISDWERSSHAKAFDLLEAGKSKSRKKKANLDPDKDYTKDDKCIKCHVTGYREDGGFQDAISTPDLKDIGCEMCHGAGEDYRVLHKNNGMRFTREEARAAGQLYGSMDDSVCRNCHSHKDSPFKPEIDEKYIFNIDEALKNTRSYHRLYPLEGKH